MAYYLVLTCHGVTATQWTCLVPAAEDFLLHCVLSVAANWMGWQEILFLDYLKMNWLLLVSFHRCQLAQTQAMMVQISKIYFSRINKGEMQTTDWGGLPRQENQLHWIWLSISWESWWKRQDQRKCRKRRKWTKNYFTLLVNKSWMDREHDVWQ